MRLTIFIAFVFVCRLFAAPESQSSASEIQLLRAGQFHGNEVSAESGEKWLCLCKTGDDFSLVMTGIVVEKCYDAVTDYFGTDTTGKCVSVPEVQKVGGEVVFLVKGLDNINQGQVETMFYGREIILPGQGLVWPAIDTDGKPWSVVERMYVSFLRATGTFEINLDSNRPYPYLENYGLVVSHETKVQQILKYNRSLSPDGMPSLLWVGDLDGDSKLDLLIDATDHYNKRLYTLYLSSYAKEGEVLGKVAEFTTLGC